MNWIIKSCIISIVTIFFFLLTYSEYSWAEDFKPYSYCTVHVRGKLVKDSDSWNIDGKLNAKSYTVKLHPGHADMIGVLFPAKKEKKPLLIILKMDMIQKTDFSIKKYEKPLELEGEKSKIIHQHPIAAGKIYFDYFEGPMGQMVIYFEDGRRRDIYSALPPQTPVVLKGTLSPLFVSSKRPGSDKSKRFFYEFQMDVDEMRVIKKGRKE